MDAWEAEIQRFREAVRRADEEIVKATQIGVAKACDAGLRESLSARHYSDVTRRLTKSAYKAYANTARGARGAFGFRAHHASYVNDGTAPHVIEAKGGGVLRFKVGGATVFAKRVNHPGTRPDQFAERGEEKVEQVLNSEIEAGVRRAARMLGGS
jgi:hypothetical protein